ncbi:MAG: S41 family peptidase [Bacteroidota bacterium]|nr:S41 family peptidase [Bacteroidota bacterium]
MNLSKLAGWLNKLLIICILTGLSGCNPYRQTIRINQNSNGVKYLLDELEQNYPFSGHKGIDWHEFEPAFTEYLSDDFSRDKYLSIRNLIYQIPDARINIRSSHDASLMKQELGAYAGFDLSRLPDGSCRVISIDSSSVAYEKGLRLGDKLLGWNGSPVHQFIQNKPVRWGIHPTSLAFMEIMQDHFMTRSSVNSSIELFYESSTGNARGIRIPFEPTKLDLTPNILEIPNGELSSSTFTISDSYGTWTILEFSPKVHTDFIKLILPELDRLKGLIIDIRQNQGGKDAIAAELAGYFLSKERLYEETLIRGIASDSWHNLGHIHAIPSEDQTFHKPIILLIGPLCSGAGEGFARILQQENHIRTMGMWETAGSFSYPGGRIRIPGKFVLFYPIGMSLDENGSIIIESSGDYGGGIYPDIRIHADGGNLIRISAGEDILLFEALAHLRL